MNAQEIPFLIAANSATSAALRRRATEILRRARTIRHKTKTDPVSRASGKTYKLLHLAGSLTQRALDLRAKADESKNQTRCALLYQGFVRGRAYRQCEPKSHWVPDGPWILKNLRMELCAEEREQLGYWLRMGNVTKKDLTEETNHAEILALKIRQAAETIDDARRRIDRIWNDPRVVKARGILERKNHA